MPQIGMFRNLLQYEFFQPSRVEIGEAFVDADRQYARVGEHLVPFDIAKMLGLRNAPDNRGMWTRGAPQKQGEAKANARDNAGFNADEQGYGYRRGHRHEVGFGIAPNGAWCFEIDKAEDGDNDCAGQGGNRQRCEQWRQKKRGKQYADGGKCTGCRCFGTGIKIDNRAGKAPCHRIASGKCSGDIGGAQANQFLIRDDPLPFLGR